MAASEGFLGWLKGLDEGYRNGLADNVTRLTNQVPIVATRGAVIDREAESALASRLINESRQEGFDDVRLAEIKAKMAEQGLDLRNAVPSSANELKEMGALDPEGLSLLIGDAMHEPPVGSRPTAAQRRVIYDYGQNGPGGPMVLPGAGQEFRDQLSGYARTPLVAYGVPAALALGGGYLAMAGEGGRNYVSASS